jgi:hypothetical protein
MDGPKPWAQNKTGLGGELGKTIWKEKMGRRNERRVRGKCPWAKLADQQRKMGKNCGETKNGKNWNWRVKANSLFNEKIIWGRELASSQSSKKQDLHGSIY